MTNHSIQLYNLVLYDVFKMMIAKLFHFDLSGKNFKQKLRHQVEEAEALRVDAEAIKKLSLPHSCLKG